MSRKQKGENVHQTPNKKILWPGLDKNCMRKYEEMREYLKNRGSI